jgi:hypothetical protein
LLHKQYEKTSNGGFVGLAETGRANFVQVHEHKHRGNAVLQEERLLYQAGYGCHGIGWSLGVGHCLASSYHTIAPATTPEVQP